MPLFPQNQFFLHFYSRDHYLNVAHFYIYFFTSIVINKEAETTLKELRVTPDLFVVVNMAKSLCCERMGMRKGPWSAEEDHILISHIQTHGHANWRALPKQAGLLRCGKSCRLRWINYLRPDIKRGKFSEEEQDSILKLHQILGNKWSTIAARLPGRTDNEVKNFWHTHLKKKVHNANISLQEAQASDASSGLASSKDPFTVSCDTNLEQNMGNHGSSQISEEMEFWYKVFIKSGQTS